ncbi:MAG: hypothetical protein B1H11_03530 [Desulfobacteraceae bacterium 4484_190.1]|nr:MAG: hypothetical protein B1H11_03530 [Desulfobacteraceae bacterium 4484_190.1]
MKKLLIVFALLFFLTLPGLSNARDEKQVTTLEEVVVTATKVEQNTMDVPFFASVVTREEFEKMGATTIEEALRSVPGLQIGTQGNAFPHIEVRGFRDTKDLAVLIDGVPFRQLNGSADLTMIPLNIVERIEFVKGPSSSIWGRGAVAGILNIITRPDNVSKLQAKVQAGGGSFSTYQGATRLVVPYSNGYFMLNAGASTSDGFQERTDRDGYNVLMHLNNKFTNNFSLGVQYLYTKVNAKRGSIIPLINGEPAFGVDREDNFGIDGAKYDSRYYSLSMSPVLNLVKGITLKDVLTVMQFDRFATGGITITPTPRTKGWWESDSDQTSIHNDLSLTWKRRFGDVNNALLVGSYFETGDQKQLNPRFSSAPTYGPPDWQTPLTNVGNPPKGIQGSTKRSDFDQSIISFYAQDRVEIGAFGFMAGVRYDNFDEELRQSTTNVKADQSDSAWSPRFAADWRAYRGQETELTLFANYVEGFRTQFPRLSTRSGETLPQILDPEETTSYEGGIKVMALNGHIFGQISAFETEKKGPRSYRTSVDDFLFTNARTRVRGVESELHCRLNQMFSFWVHYSYHDARYLEFMDSKGNSFEGYRVRMSPRNIAGAGTNFSYKNFNWNLTANYVGDRNLRDNTVTTPQNLPSYSTVNTALTYSFGKYELQFVANNIFDEFYINDDFSSQEAGNAGAPRNFFFWLRANF